MLYLLATAALLTSGPAAAASTPELQATQPSSLAPHQLTLKQKAWFEHAVEHILESRGATEQGVDASSPH